MVFLLPRHAVSSLASRGSSAAIGCHPVVLLASWLRLVQQTSRERTAREQTKCPDDDHERCPHDGPGKYRREERCRNAGEQDHCFQADHAENRRENGIRAEDPGVARSREERMLLYPEHGFSKPAQSIRSAPDDTAV